MKIETSSPGLVQLLSRHGITATNDSKKDLKLAAVFMPKPRKKATRHLFDLLLS
jgi:hypothetical protein